MNWWKQACTLSLPNFTMASNTSRMASYNTTQDHNQWMEHALARHNLALLRFQYLIPCMESYSRTSLMTLVNTWITSYLWREWRSRSVSNVTTFSSYLKTRSQQIYGVPLTVEFAKGMNGNSANSVTNELDDWDEHPVYCVKRVVRASGYLASSRLSDIRNGLVSERRAKIWVRNLGKGGSGGKKPPYLSQFPPVLFSCSRFLNYLGAWNQLVAISHQHSYPGVFRRRLVVPVSFPWKETHFAKTLYTGKAQPSI